MKPMGQSVSWAHNLFVLWTLCFLLRVILCSETQSLTLVPAGLSPPFSQSHPLFSEVVTLLSFCLLLSVSNHPLLLILVSYSWCEVSGSVMIIPDYKWKWGSNSIVFKWVFFWEWQQWHQNQFPPSKGCPAAILPKVILNNRDMVSLSNHIPVQDAIDQIKPGLRPEVFGPSAPRCLGQDYRFDVPQVKNRSIRPRPLAQRAWGPGPYKGSGPRFVPLGRGSRPKGLEDPVLYISPPLIRVRPPRMNQGCQGLEALREA